MMKKLPEYLYEETESQIQSPASENACFSSAHTSSTGSSFRTSASVSHRPNNGASSDHSQSPDLFSDGFSMDLTQSKSAQTKSEHHRHPSLNKEMDPAAVLNCAGFSGDFDNAKAITWAIAANHIRVVKYLLNGYRIPKVRRSKVPFRRDSESSDTRVASVNGAPASSHFGARKTPIPLVCAVEYRRSNIVKLLLERDASTAVQDSQGRSPLRVAAERGYLDIVRLLLAHGASVESSPDATVKEGAHPAMRPSTSASQRPEPIIAVRPGTSMSHRPPPTSPRPGTSASQRPGTGAGQPGRSASRSQSSRRPTVTRVYTPLHGAVAHGHETVAAVLLDHGADPCARDPEGTAPLHLATARGDMSCVCLLLDRGAQAGVADGVGRTPLMAAAHGGFETLLRVLLRHEAPADARDRAGHTALALAAVEGHERAAKVLLNARADPTLADRAGWTPLLRAADRGHPGVMLLLLAAGADVNARTAKGSTAIDRAEARKDAKMVAFLERSRAAENGRVSPFVEYG